MSDHQHDHAHNEKFQRERIALFSDAIFAIAITLLIIEMKPPEIHSKNLDDITLLNSLLHHLSHFIGFLVSFFVIGLYWMAHHRLFRYVVHSNHKLLSNNLLFLLPIVTMPSSTAFLSEYWTANVHLPLIVYTINIVFAGLFSFRLWKIVAAPKNHLSEGMDELVIRYNLTRALTTPIIFILVLILSYFSFWITWIIPPLIPLIISVIKRYFKKKYPALWEYHSF